MLYYRVKPAFDQRRVGGTRSFLIAYELFTEREVNSLTGVTTSMFDRIEFSKRQVYWAFGARFQNGYCYRGRVS